MITAAGNRRVKMLAHMNQSAKVRRDEDAFLTEGIKMFMEAPIERIREVFISESFSIKKHSQDQIAEKLKRTGHEVVTDEVFKKMSNTVTPQGILCVMQAYQYTLEDVAGGKRPLLLLLEDIQDPGNLGTILRTGEGAGVTGFIMSRDTVDIYNPKTIRATMGSIYRLPFVYVDHLTDTMQKLQEKGIRIYAAHLSGETFYDEYFYEEGTAFLVGNEGKGLNPETAAGADYYLKIPMAGEVESLNASIAASILMYEAYRQRRAGDKNSCK